MKLIQETSARPGHAQFDDTGSPCVGVCVTFEYRGRRYWCGCGRSIEEIGEWAGSSKERKAEIQAIASHRLNNLPIS